MYHTIINSTIHVLLVKFTQISSVEEGTNYEEEQKRKDEGQKTKQKILLITILRPGWLAKSHQG